VLEGTSGDPLVEPTCSKLHQIEQKAQHLLPMIRLLLRTFHNDFINIPYFREARFTFSVHSHMPVVNGSASAHQWLQKRSSHPWRPRILQADSEPWHKRCAGLKDRKISLSALWMFAVMLIKVRKGSSCLWKSWHSMSETEAQLNSIGKLLCGFPLGQQVSMLAQRKNYAIQDANTFLAAAYLLHKNPCKV